MKVGLSPERARFIQRCLDEGRIATPEAAVEMGLRLLEERLGENPFRRLVLRGLEQAAYGKFSPITVDDLRRQARERAA